MIDLGHKLGRTSQLRYQRRNTMWRSRHKERFQRPSRCSRQARCGRRDNQSRDQAACHAACHRFVRSPQRNSRAPSGRRRRQARWPWQATGRAPGQHPKARGSRLRDGRAIRLADRQPSSRRVHEAPGLEWSTPTAVDRDRVPRSPPQAPRANAQPRYSSRSCANWRGGSCRNAHPRCRVCAERVRRGAEAPY